MRCPNCGNIKSTIKSGIRDTSKGKVQRYYCKDCQKYFCSSHIPKTQYPENVILYTINSYNRGYTAKQAKKMAGRKFSISPPLQTIYSWLDRYQNLLTFIKLRKKYEILDPDKLTTTRPFHHQQVYPFTYHILKLNLHSKLLPPIKRYIKWLERSLPNEMFLKGPRASSTKIDIDLTPEKKDNIAPELCRLSLLLKKKLQSSHQAVEDFFLINDSSTICTEMPVFVKPDEISKIDIDTNLTGHIDIIQVRFGKVYIMDYKPNLRKPEKHVSQLHLYKEALHRRTSVPKYRIIPAVFNQYGYYELT